jgi:hypothetical protein
MSYSDHNLSFEQLTQQPETAIGKLYEVLGIPSKNIEQLCNVIQAPQTDQWKQYAEDSWFSQLEAQCEYNLSIFLNNSAQHRPQP